MTKKFKILIAKPGLDGHDVGAKVITQGLRDAGMEVIYTGIRQTPEIIVETAIQEDVDVVGLSCLSGAHRTMFTRIASLLAEKGLDDVKLICGGNIPQDDIPFLKDNGVHEVFTSGSSIQHIARYITNNARSK